MSNHALRILLLTLLAAVSIQGQQTTQPQTTQPQTTQTTPQPQPTPASTYVFPDKHQRFRRYVKSMVGPFRLGRTAFSAGINQWRDNPEEWEQGASGYGKRFASSFGRNVIRQTV